MALHCKYTRALTSENLRQRPPYRFKPKPKPKSEPEPEPYHVWLDGETARQNLCEQERSNILAKETKTYDERGVYYNVMRTFMRMRTFDVPMSEQDSDIGTSESCEASQARGPSDQ